MASGIVGSRLAYVLANWTYYRDNLLEIVRIDQGGLIFYGGFLLACVVLVLFARHHRVPLWHLADFAIPALAIGHGLGRIGCFLNGCCYGRPAGDAFCGIAYPPVCEPGKLFPGVPLFPVQIIESAGLLVIWAVLLFAYPRRKKDGAVFALYLLLYPPVRFGLEYLRGDYTNLVFGIFKSAQMTSVFAFTLALLGWLWLGWNERRQPVTATTETPSGHEPAANKKRKKK